MDNWIILITLGVSVLLGLMGLAAVIWGVRNGQFDDSKKWLEGILIDDVYELRESYKEERKKVVNIYDVVVIGTGPAGMGAAIESKILGIKNLVLLEKEEKTSSTIRKYYKDGKRVDKEYKNQVVELDGNIDFKDGIKEGTLDFFDDLLRTHEIDTRFKSEVDSCDFVDGLFNVRTTNGDIFKSRFIVVAIGKMGTPNKPSYKIPLDIRNKVVFSTSSLKGGENILVVGGGNSAVEYAYSLASNNKVTLNYRKSEFSRINDTNKELLYQYINDEKLQTKLGVDIESLENDNGLVKVNFADKSTQNFDKVLYAIGGSAPIDFLKKCDVNLDSNNIPIVDSNYESSKKGIFVAGDLLFKNGGSIAYALKHGLSIARAIHERLKS